MNKSKLVVYAMMFGMTVSAANVVAAPLPNGTKLTITKSTQIGLVQTTPCTVGSCFGMYLFANLFFWTPLGPGTDGGLIIGKPQKSGGQDLNGLSSANGELNEVWTYGGNWGTFFTWPNASSNVFDDASCRGAECGSNTTPRKTDLGVLNVAWGGNNIPHGSEWGCNPLITPACTPDHVAGIFVSMWEIDPPGTNPRNYHLDYGTVAQIIWPNFPVKFTLRGTVDQSPSVNGFWPSKAEIGKFVFIFGKGFVLNKTQVTVNGVPASFVQVADPTLLFIQLPAGNTQGPIKVTTPDGSATSTGIYGAPLSNVAVTGIWPSVVKPNQMVFTFGAGFVPNATTVSVNGLNASIRQVLDPSLMWFLAPATPTTGPVTVNTSSGSVTSAGVLTIQ